MQETQQSLSALLLCLQGKSKLESIHLVSIYLLFAPNSGNIVYTHSQGPQSGKKARDYNASIRDVSVLWMLQLKMRPGRKGSCFRKTQLSIKNCKLYL